jgi:hypothetical protein
VTDDVSVMKTSISNRRQLESEICLSARLISVLFSVCHTVSRKSGFEHVGGWERQQLSDVLKTRASFFAQYYAPKCNVFVAKYYPIFII